MALAHFRMLIHEFLNKDPDIFPEESPLIVLDSKYTICMAKNSKDTRVVPASDGTIYLVDINGTRYLGSI